MSNILEVMQTKHIIRKLEFTSPIPPSTNTYLKKCVQYVLVGGRKVPTVKVYLSTEAIQYKNHLKNIIARAKEKSSWVEPLDKNFYVECRIKAFVPQKKIDCDNFLKCLFDGIKECDLVYDDNVLIPIFEDVIIDKEKPRLEVTLRVSFKKGIFHDNHSYDSFIKLNCSRCSRFSEKRVCSILRDSLENRKRKELELRRFGGLESNTYFCNALKIKKCPKA